MEPEIEIPDQSVWHHLIFVEELANHVSNEALCALCREQALGPVYNCLECIFIQHKSCPRPTQRDWEKGMTNHSRWMKHHLISVEEVKNRAGEEAVCWGCEEPASFPAYKCSFRGCPFLLHKPCTELSLLVLLLLQSDHDLLSLYSIKKNCISCLISNGSLFYGSQRLKFYLHVKCLPRFQISSYDPHDHSVFFKGILDQFFCEACGEETTGSAFACNICHLTVEKECRDFSHTIITTLHCYHLTFTPSVRRINKQDRVFCRLCCNQVNTRYGAYYCVKCGFILHVKCARRYKDQDATIESGTSDCTEYASYLTEGLKVEGAERVVGPEKIQHFNHPHDLVLTYEDPEYDKQCEACMRFIVFNPYYSCVQCNFFLHSKCAELPTIIKRGLLHEHSLSLVAQASSREKLIHCKMCGHYRDGYAYNCDMCANFQLDVQCCLVPDTIEHNLHQHTLLRVGRRSLERKRDARLKKHCNGCGVRRGNYVCNDCDFVLCLGCATLPRVARYRYHPHLLTLGDTCDYSKEYYCLICEEQREPKVRYYWCKECDFTVDSPCILKGKFKFGSYESKDHQHPLTFMIKTKDSPPCNACGQPFVKSYNFHKTSFDLLAVECSQCNFVIHRYCQTATFMKPN